MAIVCTSMRTDGNEVFLPFYFLILPFESVEKE